MSNEDSNMTTTDDSTEELLMEEHDLKMFTHQVELSEALESLQKLPEFIKVRDAYLVSALNSNLSQLACTTTETGVASVQRNIHAIAMFKDWLGAVTNQGHYAKHAKAELLSSIAEREAQDEFGEVEE